jgi:hypothetical protein
VVKISVSAETRSTNGRKGGNYDKSPINALKFSFSLAELTGLEAGFFRGKEDPDNA